MKKTFIWLRWILFFPLAVVAYMLVEPIYLVVNLFLIRLSFFLFIPEIGIRITAVMASGFAFVIVGAKVAPKNHFVVAVILASVYLIKAVFILLSVIVLGRASHVTLTEAIISLIFGNMGAIAASYGLFQERGFPMSKPEGQLTEDDYAIYNAILRYLRTKEINELTKRNIVAPESLEIIFRICGHTLNTTLPASECMGQKCYLWVDEKRLRYLQEQCGFMVRADTVQNFNIANEKSYMLKSEFDMIPECYLSPMSVADRKKIKSSSGRIIDISFPKPGYSLDKQEAFVLSVAPPAGFDFSGFYGWCALLERNQGIWSVKKYESILL